MSDEIWAERDTTPAAIEAALRELLHHRYAQSQGAVAPARVLNLVVIVDGSFRGEIENRLERVGRYHPSRTVLCAVEPGRTTLDAVASMSVADADLAPGHLAIARERIELEIGERHLRQLDTIVVPLLVTDLATLVWAPHGHQDGVDALRRLAQIALVDSSHELASEPELDVALERAAGLTADLYVVDLAWLRSTPWRERVAAMFDPPPMRRALHEITTVTVRHRNDSAAAAALFCGWLASRLGWRPERLMARGGEMIGHARARRGEVTLRLEPVDEMSAPGLGGVTIECASGTAISLDRSPGGLRARRRTRDGDEQSWTVLGASRGESGILGEGVRQALLRDHTYRPALEAARALVAG